MLELRPLIDTTTAKKKIKNVFLMPFFFFYAFFGQTHPDVRGQGSITGSVHRTMDSFPAYSASGRRVDGDPEMVHHVSKQKFWQKHFVPHQRLPIKSIS